MSNTTVQECLDAAVTKHNYHVTLRHTMGPIVLEEDVVAGSIAHAAMLVGMILLGDIQRTSTNVDVSMHNAVDHLIVEVDLIV